MSAKLRLLAPALALLALLSAACSDETGTTTQTDPPGSTCGDGHVDAGEACDDGNVVAGDGCSATCTDETDPPVCGDSAIDDGEECDDGNTVDGDGCSAACLDEAAATCGDGQVDPGEQCDDSNTTSGDGCSATCQDEVPETCGDAVVDAGEDCDDGNEVNGDGCENDCTITPEAEIVCEVLAPLASGTCSVTAGDDSKLIIGDVLSPTTIYRGGQVLVDATGNITCVGCDCDLSAGGATQIVCPTGVISPGLINTHDHITYAQNDPYTDTGERYEHRHDWRKGKNGHTQLNTPGSASTDQVRWGELRFLMGGATSTVGSGSASGFLRNLDKANDQEGLISQDAVHYETFPLDDSGGTQLSLGCSYGTIDTAASIAGDDAYFPHVAEGIDAFARNEFVCLSSTANGGQDLVQPQSSFIHSIGLSPVDYASMAMDGTALIWSPRSNVTLYGDTAVVTEASRLGVLIALGTDWIATGSMNLLRELQCADGLNTNHYGGFFSDKQLWEMVTGNAARTTATDDVIGALSVGRVADISIFDGTAGADYRAIIDAEPQHVVLVMRAGTVLYGDDTVVEGVPGSGACDVIDVCGVDKAICATGDIGKSYAALQAAAGASTYPAFFCGTPASEPSCTPSRPVSVSGSTVYTGAITATDADGDGILDAADICPTVFDPIRPRDGGAQADFDGDGDGDACDVCPLNAGTTICSGFDPNDADADGILNANDNCPVDPNAGQEDADLDMKGDACDLCPDVANPGNAACTFTIYDVKTGVVPLGTQVALGGVLVTGKHATGFFVQHKAGDAAYVGADHSGIYVYAPANTVTVGDRVTVTTSVAQDFFGQIQLSSATVVIDASLGEAPPDPVVELPANIATGGSRAAALEGVIVQVQNVVVTDVAPALGTGDVAPSHELVVDGALRVNDLLYLITPFPVLGGTFDSLTGVLEMRYGDSKIEPRDTNDVISGPPKLVGLSPTPTFSREGDVAAPTFPAALTVSLSRAADVDTFVAITSNDPALVVVGGGVTIPMGASSMPVLVDGIAPALSVDLTATLNADMLTANVRVLGIAEQPVLTGLLPAAGTVVPGGTLTLTATLDIPAPPGGVVVTLDLSPANAGLIPATVTIPEDATSATFDYVDLGMVQVATVSATLGVDTFTADIAIVAKMGTLVLNEADYDQIGGDTAEFVELYNGSGVTIDPTNLALLLINGSASQLIEYKRVALAPAGMIAPGQYVVIATVGVVVPAGALKVDFELASDNVQNGAPDAMAILDVVTGDLIDSLSYEGAVLGATVNGFGTKDFVEGTVLPVAVADSNVAVGSLCRLPDGSDTDDAATDWAFSSNPTPGVANVP